MYTIIIVLLSCSYIGAQDISQIVKSKPFAFSGSLYLSGDSYSNFGNSPLRRSPYSYAIIGSPVLTIYGISLPFDFSFSDQQFSYSQPFNIYGVSPRYKWAQIHLGYRGMNFSSLVMSGKQFYGSGIELNPGKFRFKALYGKLKDLYAQRDTLTFGTNIIDTYERMINGVKIGYGSRNKIDFMYVKVRDKDNNLAIKEADNNYLLPEDNLVLGLNTSFTLFKNFQFFIETAASLHTANQRADIEIEDKDIAKLAKKIKNLIELNASTRWGFAGKTGLQYKHRGFGIGATYHRVDPFYKSLGLYYMNTDFENYAGNLSFGLFKNKVQLRITGGFQKNNLSKLKQSTDLRKIGSVSLSYFSPGGLSLVANYSNYQTDQTAGYVKVNDSLKLALVNEMAMFSPSYSWKKGKNNHSINASISYQKFKDINQFRKLSLVNDKNYNISLNYNLSTPAKTNYNLGINYFSLASGDNVENQIGLNLGVSKRLFKNRLNIRVNGSWNKNTYNSESDGYSLSARNTISYKITKNQNISFGIIWMNRTGLHRRNINELRSSLNYGLTF